MKITDIIPAPWNTRTAITDESVKSLAASMEADGLIQPISVCGGENGHAYICYDGNRRLAAAKLLGWTEIPANHTRLTIEEAKVRTVTANLQRDDDDPLLAAGVIAALLDSGMDAGGIAAKLGKTVGWVNRRRKLIGAADALKSCADRVTVEALERIAVLPEKAQVAVCKSVEAKAKYMGRIGLSEIRYDIERESRDLTSVKFDCGACVACAKRTGAEADLFGEPEGGLGKCLDCKCFEAKSKAWEDAEIARLVGGAEVVRVKYAWELPRGEESSPKPTKKHPCAYVCVSGGLEVRWGESAKAAKKREAEEKAKRDAANAEREAVRSRVRDIVNTLDDAVGEECDEAPDWLIGGLKKSDAGKLAKAAARFVMEYHSDEEWVKILTAFPFIAGAVKLTAADVKFLKENANK